MIQNNLSPILFSIEFFSFNIDIRVYSLVYLIGTLIIYFLLQKNKNQFNLKEKEVDNFIFFSFINMILFARFFHVLFYNITYYINHLLEIFMIWKGGLSLHGGIFGFLLTTYFFSKRKKFSIYQFLNFIILPVTFILGLGRIANFFNHEIVGIRTDVLWCVIFEGYSGCRHPAQLYEALVWFSIFFIILINEKILKKKIFENRLIFTIIFYSIARFFIEFFKNFEVIGILKMGQYLSLLTIVISLYIYIKYKNLLK
ncbi:MAG: prolipoprotein diacylglyceryl transferase [Candidatus Woesearchaeota archaeon]